MDISTHDYFDSLITNLFAQDFQDGLSNLYEWQNEHSDFINKKHLSFEYGVTKVCIIDSQRADWVIKIGFKHRGCDYAAKEYANWLAAQEYHVEQYFAPMEDMGIYDDTHVFLQVYAPCASDSVASSRYNYALETLDPHDFENDDDYYNSVDNYSEDMSDTEVVEIIFGECSRLIDFLDEKGINDLHDGNWGFLSADDIVIIDYAGFD